MSEVEYNDKIKGFDSRQCGFESYVGYCCLSDFGKVI